MDKYSIDPKESRKGEKQRTKEHTEQMENK